MKKARFTETQILRVLKEVEGGRHVKDVCRENGVSEASYYNWKSKYGGMESSDIKRMALALCSVRYDKQDYNGMQNGYTVFIVY